MTNSVTMSVKTEPDDKISGLPVDTQVFSYVDEIMKIEVIQEAFINCLVHNEEHEAAKLAEYQTMLNKVLKRFTPENMELAIKSYISSCIQQRNPGRMRLLYTLLENEIHAGTVPARLVCEILLAHDMLVHEEEQFWLQSFKLIKNVLSLVDYKGVREIMKTMLEKSRGFPVSMNVAILPQIRALETVIKYIFDRNSALLPAYFIADAILKAYPNNKVWPSWRLSDLLSKFVEDFRLTAQLVSVIGRSKMLPVVEHSGHFGHSINAWKLEASTLRFLLKGNLPYDREYLEAQSELLKYVLVQPYSRDMVLTMLGLQKQQKQRCYALEEQIVELLVAAMEESEAGKVPSSHWQHLSSQLIYFVLFQFTSFPHMVSALNSKLCDKKLRKGRDDLMWVLLQFISGSIQKNPLSDFLPVLKLYDLLYPEKEPLPVPDIRDASCTHEMAVTCIWIHLMKKAQTDNINMHRPVPYALKEHHEFLQRGVKSVNHPLQMDNDYCIALLCNAYSTNQEFFSRPMGALVETIQPGQKVVSTPMPGSNCMAQGPTEPLSMDILDSLTVHAKMSLIHAIVTNVIKLAQQKSTTLALAPALVETYSRLLVYMEIESLGIKGFISQLLPQVFQSHAWGILHTLLEMFSYRLHHIQPHYRVQLLSKLHNLATVPQTNHTQLQLCVESTALRLITGLGSAEVQQVLQRYLAEPKSLISTESEELNRALVLTLARAIHVTGSECISGSWCKELLPTIMSSTPHSWASHTLQCFPPPLVEFYSRHPPHKENRQQLKKAVEEEYRKWVSMANENDILEHFSMSGTPSGTQPLLLCLIWKMILDTDHISPVTYKVLERVGARALSQHLRIFCDYFCLELGNCSPTNLSKYMDAVNSMIWKYHIVTIDRFILTLVLHNSEDKDAPVYFIIMNFLLVKHQELQVRVKDFVKENSPEHWKQSNWHEKHLAFHKKYPETFAPEGMLEHGSTGSSLSKEPHYQTLPVYFGNACLRFLPVFDIVIHRYLENPGHMTKVLEALLDNLGMLYKFHDRPVTYLYNTLHYYERLLTESPLLKRKLVSTILGAQKELHPAGWCLSAPFSEYLERSGPESEIQQWIPELDYYMKLVQRLVDTMAGKKVFQSSDWRFNEFSNASAHALYTICVELMALPIQPQTIGSNLLDVVLKGHTTLPRQTLEKWNNAIGLILTSLPESYWTVILDRLMEQLETGLKSFTRPNASCMQLFNYNLMHSTLFDVQWAYLLALCHAVFHHSSIGQLSLLPQFISKRVRGVIQKEEQLMFVLQLVGPFLQRLHAEKTRALMELTIELYELLHLVDKHCAELQYMDVVCDLLYHIKYMYTGDTVKGEVEEIIKSLRPALQLRLRFITHLNIEGVGPR